VGGGLVAGWNTFAQVHNTYRAVQAIPGVFSRLGDFFGGKSSSGGDGKNKLVIILVAVAVLGGILTTYGIVQATRRSVLVKDSMRA
jgi:hypothetical protein